jgi:hypothetical protein
MTDPTQTPNTPQTYDNEPPREQRLSSLQSTAPEATAGNATDDSASDPRRTSSQSLTQRTSSRDTIEMNRSSTPPDTSSTGSIKYTRTGRISKAAKGQRIHHCDECGKVSASSSGLTSKCGSADDYLADVHACRTPAVNIARDLRKQHRIPTNAHSRRHQQNHKPGAFPCDVEGCGRSFYREDLLTRHKIRQ